MGLTKQQRLERGKKAHDLSCRERIDLLACNKWLQKKHEKHSKMIVAHPDSSVGTGRTSSWCHICFQSQAVYSLVNKRKKGNKATGLQFCSSHIDDVTKVFKVDFDYCK